MEKRLGATFGAASSFARRLSEDVGSSSGGISYEHKIEGGLLFFIVVISLGAGTYFLWVMRRIWANRARSAKVLDEIEMEFVNDIEDEELMATCAAALLCRRRCCCRRRRPPPRPQMPPLAAAVVAAAAAAAASAAACAPPTPGHPPRSPARVRRSQDAPDWGTIDERSRSPSTEAMTPSTPQSDIATPSR